jgi:hypothetical protein
VRATKCSWPGCDRTEETEVIVTVDDGQPPWCLEHLLDDHLPEVVPGTLGYCASCNQMCVTWVVGPPDVALHERCRRAHAMGGVVTTERGAWARRRSATAG